MDTDPTDVHARGLSAPEPPDDGYWLHDPRSWQRRVVAVVAAVLSALAGRVALGIGGCHSSSGFCAGEFSDDHAGMLVFGVVLAGAAGWALGAAAAASRTAKVVATALAACVAAVVAVSSLP